MTKPRRRGVRRFRRCEPTDAAPLELGGVVRQAGLFETANGFPQRRDLGCRRGRRRAGRAPRAPGCPSAQVRDAVVRSRLQTLAACLLGLDGVLTILWAAFLPLPPFSSHPVPVAMQALGVAGLAAG